jgi:hypothetical protein
MDLTDHFRTSLLGPPALCREGRVPGHVERVSLADAEAVDGRRLHRLHVRDPGYPDLPNRRRYGASSVPILATPHDRNGETPKDA